MILRLYMGIAGLLSICLLSCGSGNNESTSNVSNVSTRQISAKNVLLTSAHASLGDKNTSKKELDTTTTVSADNVLIDTAANSLTSTNLQDALDKEMAINLSQMLPGTTWMIINKTTDPVHKGCATGQVTFSADTLMIDQGSFAAAGLRFDTTCGQLTCDFPDTPISYEVLQNSIMYVTWRNNNWDWSANITIFARNRNTLSMIGEGGCGGQGMSRISILTKVQ